MILASCSQRGYVGLPTDMHLAQNLSLWSGKSEYSFCLLHFPFFSVARDSSLHEFLDSFLQFRSRWYDFPHRGAKGIVAGVIVGELELSRRVFMVLYRM